MHSKKELPDSPGFGVSLKLDVHSEKDFWGSGDGFKPAKHEVSKKVLYPSDHAISRQVRTTREIQRNLSDALDNLESRTALSEVQTLCHAILNLYKKTQHLSQIVDILDKLNKEIKFCRINLPGLQDANSKAKLSHRIEWLEKGILTLVERNSSEKLDELLELKTVPEIKVPNEKQVRKTSLNLVSSASFFTEVPGASPTPKSIIHLTPDVPLSQQTFERSSLKKTATLPPVSFSIPENEETKSNADASDAYWSSGHHQFIYSPNKDIIMQENALSYHYLGLAMPANFVTPTSEEYIISASLPWLTDQNAAAGNFDILRGDLERVLRRTRRIQDKVWKAANLSVEFDVNSSGEDNNENYEIVSKLQSRGSTRGRKRIWTGGSTVGSFRSDVTRATSSMKSSRPGSSSSIMSSSTYISSGSLADLQPNTKNIQQLTRTNMSKRYPHVCDRWTEARPDSDHLMTQQTIVNQRNLYNQTKLKLFVTKRNRDRSSIRRDLITPNSVTSNRSFRRIGSGIRFIEKLKSSGGNALSQPQKQRLEDLLTTGIKSEKDDVRIYAAKSLSFLGVADSDSTVPVLTDLVKNDSNAIVRFEASKALLNLGFCSCDAVRELTLHLRHGNDETKLDVLEQIACTSTIRGIFHEIEYKKVMRKLVKELRQLAESSDANEEIVFRAAVCLGLICGHTDEDSAVISQTKLKHAVLSSTDWTVRAQSLEVLVRCLNYCDEEIFNVIVKHLINAVKWKDRLAAALLIAFLGPNKLEQIVDEETLYRILSKKMYDDVKRDVRLGVSQAITALGMRNRLMEDLDNSLHDSNEEIRSQAVIAMSGAGIRSDTTLRFLVEMLGLDSSDYVRLQVIRTFQALGVTDIRVVRAVREREKSGGPLARAAQRYLNAFDIPLASSQASQRRAASSNAFDRNLTRGNSSWSYNTRASNIFTRESMRSKTTLNSPTKSSRKASSVGLNTDSFPKIEILSTATRKSPSKKSPYGKVSFSDGRLLTSASSIF
uniref:uncharacterized protein LOC120341127 isoform X1 n=1 Tax=Styela clava TaxID=7725 RepID=UPI001939BA5B|nr:uncharacterized protein LOC120341127 isoform X1 [Styela clava]XP_039265504.1 uncharacterized protein LOC120341127 isoform X1 [Styela clava]